MREIRHIVIHCSATPNGKPVTIEEIDRWHRARGFARRPAARDLARPSLAAVGYHFVIGTDGQVMPGREPEEVGAHVQGSNARSLGVCMIGTSAYTLNQWTSLGFLIAKLKEQYPDAQVLGHRDFSPDKNGDGVIEEWEWTKTCPGFDAAAWWAGGGIPAGGLWEES